MSSQTFDPDAFTSFEATGWNEQAALYHDFFAPITTRVIDQLLDAADVRAGKRVLDIATGPGYVAAACARRGAIVVGIDIASEMLRIARRLVPHVDFRESDAVQLPFPESCFDAVTGNFAVLHLARPERAIAEFSRVLTPGGMVSLSTWDTPDRCRLAGVFVEAVQQVGATPPPDLPPGPEFFRYADDSEFIKLLARAGLEDVQVCATAFTHLIPSIDALWDGLLGGTVRTRALVAGQPVETQRMIRAAFNCIVGEYLTDGTIEIPVSVKIAAGRKSHR